VKNFMVIARNVDVTPLMLAITRRQELWKEDTYLRGHAQGPTGDVESIILRFPIAAPGETASDQHESFDHPAYAKLTEARPIVMSLMSLVGGERLGRTIINRIKPGGSIYPHADAPDHAAYYDRFHVVLQSSPGADFRAGDEHVYMATGEVWWFDNSQEHEVINNSATDRIHLVVDIRTSAK